MPATPAGTSAETLACVRGKRIVLISHDLGQTGSPLLLVETGAKLRGAGAQVRLVTLGDDGHKNNCASRAGIEIVARSVSFEECARADLTIANTAAAWPWVSDYLQARPDAGRSLLWWIHEMDPRPYTQHMSGLRQSAAALFDSCASLESWRKSGLQLPAFTEFIHPGVSDSFLRSTEQPDFRFPRTGVARFFRRQNELLTRAQIRRRMRIEAHEFALLLIGLPSPLKGQSLLMSTANRMLSERPGLALKLVMIGFPSARAMKRFASEHRGAALGALRMVRVVQDLAPYFAAADALVMNSQGQGENFGRVTTEAMAFQLPVLGTDAAGTREIVRHGITGLLHPVGSGGQDQLAENVLTLMKAPGKARALGEAGHRRIHEDFTERRFLEQFGQFVERMLAQSAAR